MHICLVVNFFFFLLAQDYLFMACLLQKAPETRHFSVWVRCVLNFPCEIYDLFEYF